MILAQLAAQASDIVPSTSEERFVVLIGGQITLAAGVIASAWFNRAATGGVKKAVEEQPTANGFAGRTEKALATILKSIDRVEGKIDDHIHDHAAADVRRRTGD